MSLKDTIDQVAADATKLHSIVHGTSSQTVSTEGGTVKAVAKAVADGEAAILAGGSGALALATAQATAAAASATSAQGFASQAAASAASAASVVQQDLSAIDKTFHTATINDVFVYDTSRDPDGGAWRRRCAHLSWYQETMSGTWLGERANEAAARAVSGATTSDYYHNTTDGKFYKLSAGSGQAEVFRGNKREFPAVAIVVAEAAKLIIYDATETGVPMWMVFGTASGNALNTGSSPTMTSVVAGVGMLWVGFGAGTSADALVEISLLRDAVRVHQGATINQVQPLWGESIALRNDTTGGDWFIASSLCVAVGLVAAKTNSVSMTVLPGAPVDPLTRLPRPTVAVATDSGVSVITNNGATWDITTTFSTNAKAGRIAIDERYLYWLTRDSNTYLARALHPTGDISSVQSTDTVWWVSGRSSTAAEDAFLDNYSPFSAALPRALGGTLGLIRLQENFEAPLKGMAAYFGTDYMSGWVPDACLGAWLADSVAETLTGTELITNGDFASDISSWTAVAGTGTVAYDAGTVKITQPGGSSEYLKAYQAITTVIGKKYVVTAELTASSSAANQALCVSDSAAPSSAGTWSPGKVFSTFTATGKKVIQFTATATTTYVGVQGAGSAGTYGNFDNISVRAGSLDRSSARTGLQAVGSITKAVVDTGAQLVGFSGYTTTDYLHQIYQSSLDFGTAPFAFILAGKFDSNSADEVIFERGYYTGGAYSGARIRLELLAAGTLKLTLTDGTNTTTITTANAVDNAVWRAGLIVGFDGQNLRICSGSTDLATPVARGSVGSLSNANAVLRVGLGVDGTTPGTHVTLALLRATAGWPTADQAAYIRATERPVFLPSAKCCLDGTSANIQSLAYDEKTELLHVGTSWGRSSFRGLVRVDSEAQAIGAIRALSAYDGTVVQGGGSAADVAVPAKRLRDELTRDAEDGRGIVRAEHWFDGYVKTDGVTVTVGATTLLAGLTSHPLAVGDKVACANFDGANASAINSPTLGYHTVLAVPSSSSVVIDLNSVGLTITATGGTETVTRKGFRLPTGWRVREVADAGSVKRIGSSKDYTVLDDGFAETVLFGTAPANGSNVRVIAERG